MNTIEQARSRFGLAWVVLCLCLAAHVTDEALTGFLQVYNPTVLSIRRHFPFLPLPTFTFRIWLSGLVIGVCVLLLLSVLAFRGARWMIALAYLFAILMLCNALGHLGSSVYFGRVMPGAYSAPLLLAGSLGLLWSARRLGHAKS
jgi:hypothetical protein